MQHLIAEISSALRAIDSSGISFKGFQPGAGPYGEPQLVRMLLAELKHLWPEQYATASTKRVPDLLVPGQWALEFKIARPFGDNGREAEHWSQNLLHPYEGNVSALGDALKLLRYSGPERRGVVVIAFEHSEPKIDIHTLVKSFEVIASEVLSIPLGPRCTSIIEPLIHPVHQRARLFGWELFVSTSPTPA